MDDDEEPLIEDQSGTNEGEPAPKTNTPKPQPKPVQSKLPSKDKGKGKEITPAPVIEDERTTSENATSSNPLGKYLAHSVSMLDAHLKLIHPNRSVLACIPRFVLTSHLDPAPDAQLANRPVVSLIVYTDKGMLAHSDLALVAAPDSRLLFRCRRCQDGGR